MTALRELVGIDGFAWPWLLLAVVVPWLLQLLPPLRTGDGEAALRVPWRRLREVAEGGGGRPQARGFPWLPGPGPGQYPCELDDANALKRRSGHGFPESCFSETVRDGALMPSRAGKVNHSRYGPGRINPSRSRPPIPRSRP